MKKLLSVLLIFVLSSSLFACSKNPSETEPTAPDRDFKVTMKAYVHYPSFGFVSTGDSTKTYEFEDIQEGDKFSWEQFEIIQERYNENPVVEILRIDDDSVMIKTEQGTEEVKYDHDQTVYEASGSPLADHSYVIFTKEPE